MVLYTDSTEALTMETRPVLEAPPPFEQWNHIGLNFSVYTPRAELQTGSNHSYTWTVVQQDNYGPTK